MTPPTVSRGASGPLGVTVVADEHTGRTAVNVAVWAPEATTVEFCLFTARDADGNSSSDTELRVPLPWRSGGVRYAHITGPGPGDRYGLRVDGVWDPDTGRYSNHAKLLIDPYARIIESPLTWHPLMSGFDGTGDADPRDSAPVVPKCVIPETGEPLTAASSRPERPRHAAADLIIYEAHLKGLSAAHPEVPEDLRGTYAGMAHPAVISHLTDLGVTAVELLPLQTFIDDRFLVNRGLTNYWGYQPVNWFAPEPRYATDRSGVTADREIRGLVDALHTAGIEVILDVVYNHSGEGEELGPTLSLRGLDNNGYHLMDGPEFVNDTGTGNTLAVDHPPMLRLVTDSLRYWVTDIGVDGFRFDLGATLGRVGAGSFAGFTPDAAFFRTVAQDPVLSQVRLIAEPWDIGPDGYRLGQFPSPWAEWNDRFRDGIRRLWRGDSSRATDLGSLLLGSAGLFDGPARWPAAPATTSVNFLTAHDGFTLADVVSYNDRHNEANGEHGNDGHGENFSDNLGVEGPTDDPAVVAARARRVRGMLATLLLSQGTPMLLAGDEMGNSQGGNNNAYVQDNPTGWVDWSGADGADGAAGDLLTFTRELIALRHRLPVLRQSAYRHGQLRADGHPDVEWFRADGTPMTDTDWHATDGRPVGVVLRGTAGDTDGEAIGGAVVIVVNTGCDAEVTLPAGVGAGGGVVGGADGGVDGRDSVSGGGRGRAVWTLELDTARVGHSRLVSKDQTNLEHPTWNGNGPYPVAGQSVVVFSAG
ncbi:glycogen debranching protein GlgX [uncultured Corynebacterium sp.]|uniref:glycogen debranching protein GlgX n=1 Tax=uncultured Corynebacterium sp. TaxID=159447 RepID=UPI0025EC5A0D|nr:glycogen debranching protein GlgX [uncultured Corynebacterium sp.]